MRPPMGREGKLSRKWIDEQQCPLSPRETIFCFQFRKYVFCCWNISPPSSLIHFLIIQQQSNSRHLHSLTLGKLAGRMLRCVSSIILQNRPVPWLLICSIHNWHFLLPVCRRAVITTHNELNWMNEGGHNGTTATATNKQGMDGANKLSVLFCAEFKNAY